MGVLVSVERVMSTVLRLPCAPLLRPDIDLATRCQPDLVLCYAAGRRVLDLPHVVAVVCVAGVASYQPVPDGEGRAGLSKHSVVSPTQGQT